jgi:hypothetical protein
LHILISFQGYFFLVDDKMQTNCPTLSNGVEFDMPDPSFIEELGLLDLSHASMTTVKKHYNAYKMGHIKGEGLHTCVKRRSCFFRISYHPKKRGTRISCSCPVFSQRGMCRESLGLACFELKCRPMPGHPLIRDAVSELLEKGASRESMVTRFICSRKRARRGSRQDSESRKKIAAVPTSHTNGFSRGHIQSISQSYKAAALDPLDSSISYSEARNRVLTMRKPELVIFCVRVASEASQPSAFKGKAWSLNRLQITALDGIDRCRTHTLSTVPTTAPFTNMRAATELLASFRQAAVEAQAIRMRSESN